MTRYSRRSFDAGGTTKTIHLFTKSEFRKLLPTLKSKKSITSSSSAPQVRGAVRVKQPSVATRAGVSRGPHARCRLQKLITVLLL
jgi:hypothetical protein